MPANILNRWSRTDDCERGKIPLFQLRRGRTDHSIESYPWRVASQGALVPVAVVVSSGINLSSGGINRAASSCNGGREFFISCVTWGIVLLLLVGTGSLSVVPKREGRDARLSEPSCSAFFVLFRRYDVRFFKSKVICSGIVASLFIVWSVIFMIGSDCLLLRNF